MLAGGERCAKVLAPPPTYDPAVSPCFYRCPAFLHRHFPSQSPSSSPLNPSLRSQQPSSPWDHSTIPKLQLPAAAPSSLSMSLCQVCMAAASTVRFSFHLGCYGPAVLRSALRFSPLIQTIAPVRGSEPCFSSPAFQRQVQSY